MLELGLVFGLLAALVGGAAVVSRAPWDWLLGGGSLLALLGLLIGVPAGVWYHVRLYRALRPRGPLPAMWWLRPDRLHADLGDEQRALVMRPFYPGAVGFVMAIGGCVLVAYGAWRSPPG